MSGPALHSREGTGLETEYLSNETQNTPREKGHQQHRRLTGLHAAYLAPLLHPPLATVKRKFHPEICLKHLLLRGEKH